MQVSARGRGEILKESAIMALMLPAICYAPAWTKRNSIRLICLGRQVKTMKAARCCSRPRPDPAEQYVRLVPFRCRRFRALLALIAAALAGKLFRNAVVPLTRS